MPLPLAYIPFLSSIDPQLDQSVRVPLLLAASSKGIKKTGLVYQSGKSWAAGLLLVTLSIIIFVITIVTTIVQH